MSHSKGQNYKDLVKCHLLLMTDLTYYVKLLPWAKKELVENFFLTEISGSVWLATLKRNSDTGTRFFEILKEKVESATTLMLLQRK